MYIEPNTTIKLYSGIPLDNTYKNTLFFANVSAQNSYFHSGIQKYTFARQSYQRVERGRMRIEVLADNIYDCNYLAFQNENFGNKWFYAFINSIDYVNNTTSEITFEIDVMQTWYFDYELLDSFIDREHTNNDTIGANLVDEELELGDYIQGGFDRLGIDNYKIVMMVNEWWTYTQAEGYHWEKAGVELAGGVLQGVHYIVLDNDSTGLSQLEQHIKNYNDAGKTGEVVGIFLIPSIALPQGGSQPNSGWKDITPNYGSFDGYSPRNNKLYVHPYNTLYVSNMQGVSKEFPYEYFTKVSGKCRFTYDAIPTAKSELVLFPYQFKGSTGENMDEAISLSGFPQCAFNVDTYKAWLAQNSVSLASSMITPIALGALSAIALPITAPVTLGAVTGGALGITNVISQIQQKRTSPYEQRGVDTATVLCASKKLDYIFINKRIRGEYARIIDDFFTMYGYKTNRVKTPNIHVRQRWTYTKTIGCNLKGEAPVNALKKIVSIYDNGITFWVNASEVGNYALSNPTI